MKRIVTVCCIVFLCNLFLRSVRAEEQLDLRSKYVYVMNLDTHAVMYEKAADQKMYPASMTKIMTTMVALDQIKDVNQTLTVSGESFFTLQEEGAAVAGFQDGEQVTVKDLLYGTMLPSGADAARAIAIHTAGSESAFIELMNQKAKELKCTQTHFVNTSGLHDEDHYSTAQDMAIILEAALQDERFQEIFSADSYTTSDGTKTFYSTRVSALMNAGIDEAYLTGSKTGFTYEAGLCIAATMIANDASYIMITGQAGDDVEEAPHIQDTNMMYHYLLEHYEQQILYEAGEVVGQGEARYGSEAVEGYVKDRVSQFHALTDEIKTAIKWDMKAPVDVNEQIGTLEIQVKDKLTEVPIYAKTAVARNWFLYLFTSGWCLVWIALILIPAVIWQIRIRRKKAYS